MYSPGTFGAPSARRRGLRFLLIGIAATTALVLSACSSEESSAPPPGPNTPKRMAEPMPPPAEPAVAPPQTGQIPGKIIPVGQLPEGIVADAVTRTVAVGARNPNVLALINADSGEVTTRVPLPGILRHLQLAAPGGPVLIPDETTNALLRVRLPGGPVQSQLMTGRGAHDATQMPNGDVFVANEGGGSVSVVRNNRVIKNFEDVTQPAGLAQAGNIAGLIDVRENTITFYDWTTLTPILELPAGAGPTHLIADKHGRMIATDTRGDALYLFDPAGQPREVARLAVPGQPYGITYDPQRDRLWVTATARNEVIGYDMTEALPKEVARIPTVSQANTVAVDPQTGRLFVTGTNDGTVQMIDPPAA